MSARKIERKPVSFSTTMRNPTRIASFLEVVASHEGEILDNDVIMLIVKAVLKKKIYCTMPEKKNKELGKIFNDEKKDFTDDQLEQIIKISPQKHKEAGFEWGWPSRFDTWYRLPKEFGFIYYKVGEKIEISEAGHLLISAANMIDNNNAEKEVQNIFLNALVKYQTNNPFRKNLIDNAPFILFIQTVNILNHNYDWEKTGIYRSEIPFVTCWPNSNASELAKYINDFRKVHGKRPSVEIVYESCLKLLDSTNKRRFKIDQIVKEGVDDFIRKLRITGLISLRGLGRLIDINKFEIDKVNYIINAYSNYQSFENEYDYYLYIGFLDKNLIDIASNEKDFNIANIRLNTLDEWASETSRNVIDEELRILGKRNFESKHDLLKYIDRPTRFEFLTSIALKQQFPTIDIIPNYAIDDEGMPTFTARGGIGDIEIFGTDDVLVEVTLMQNKSQAVNEIPGITRHLKDFCKNKNKDVYSLFIAPTLHPDTVYMIDFTKFRNNLEINGYTIEKFVTRLRNSKKIGDLRIVG